MGAEVLVGAPATRQLLTNSLVTSSVNWHMGAPATRPLLTNSLVTSSVNELLGRHSKRIALKLLEVVSRFETSGSLL